MATKVTDLSFLTPLRKFLIQRMSRLMPVIPKVGYYVNMRHLRDGGSLQDRFLYSFNSQIYPTILAGVAQFLPDYDIYLTTEFDFRLLTENDFNLIQDFV